MGQRTSGAMTADAVQFLTTFGPQRLQVLRRTYPGDAEAHMLSGAETAAAISPISLARLAAVVAGLETFLETWAAVGPSIILRMRRSGLAKAIGEILAVLGSGSATGLLASGYGGTSAVWASVIALVGSLISVAERYLRRDVFDLDLFQLYKDLTATAARAAELVRDLRPHLDAGDDEGQLSAIELKVGEANKLLGVAHQQIAGLPVVAQSPRGAS